jgi:beta-N-acetylhexosaminidase
MQLAVFLLSLSVACRAESRAPLSLEKQIGQLIMITAGPKDAAKSEAMIRKGRIGGVLLRAGNMTGDEVRALTSKLQSWAADAGAPLLIAVDNEGGPEFSMKTSAVTAFPSNMARGATYSDMYAFLASYFDAKELRSLGVAMNFAPVLDVNTNPANPIIGLRSFGGDPNEVSSLGAIAIQGSLRGRVAAVGKHFPGHGDTSHDSHVSLPVVARTRAELDAVELAPFRAAIEAGVPAIMTAHVAYPALDPSGEPATLSAPIVSGLLRGELKFQGVVVTDDLEMKAIADRWSVPEAAVRAVAAGCDLLLIGSSRPQPVFDAIVKALNDGALPMQALERAADRVVRLKSDLGLGEEAATLSEEDKRRIEKLADQIAERSVTVLEDGGLLPLTVYKKALVVLFAPPGFASDLDVLAKALRERMPQAAVAVLDAEPEPKAAAALVRTSKKADLLVVGTFHWGKDPYVNQVKTVRRLLDSGRPTILVSLMNPYDQRYFKGARTRLATYGVTAASMRALARVLFGQSKPQGLLPVEVSTPSQ